MKKLIKVNNNEITFPLNLNYESIYSSLKIFLGERASLFAEIVPMSQYTTWYASDDTDYERLSEVSQFEINEILPHLNSQLNVVRNELRKSQQFAPYVDDILRIPDNSYIFYRKTGSGYKFVIAGWGCRLAHSSSAKDFVFSRKAHIQTKNTEDPSQPYLGANDFSDEVNLRPEDFIDNNNVKKAESADRDSDPVDGTHHSPAQKATDISIQSKYTGPKTQTVTLRVLDQNGNTVAGESVTVHSSSENGARFTDDNGEICIGILNVGDTFSVSFPSHNNIERFFEVESDVAVYDAHIKKLVKYSPVLFVEDQNGNPVKDHNIKVIVGGKESQINTGDNGVVQLQMMQEGQKFIAVDTANYANTAEFDVTPDKAKSPYHFIIKLPEKKVVGISVVDKHGSPIQGVTIEMPDCTVPCSQITDINGRAEFPYEMFHAGKVSLMLKQDGQSPIKHSLKFNPLETEYGLIIKDKKFDWKKLARLGVLPLIGLLGWGGYNIYDKLVHSNLPVDKMKTGVVLVLEQTSYYVDFEIADITYGNEPLMAYFTYDQNKNSIENITLSREKAIPSISTGTGFLISDDGMIATNKHVADPEIPQELAEKILRLYFQERKDLNQQRGEEINDSLNILGLSHLGANKYKQLYSELKYHQNQVRIMDKILNTGNFKVKKNTELYVAFTGTKIDPNLRNLDGFLGCNHLISGDQGDQVTANDVAIIQLRNKDKEIPAGAFVYTVPEKDILDKHMPKNRRVTIIGFNKGFGLQHLELQDGIQPQIQSGELNNLSEKYRIGYSVATLGGSSGSPVLNDDGMLIAVNNSGAAGTESFNYGVRVKYLREILEQIEK